MKRNITLALLGAIIIVLSFTSCAYVTGAAPTVATPDYASLALTKSQFEQWQSQGMVNVATQQEASALAGFDVKTPDWIPSDLTGGIAGFIVTRGNAADQSDSNSRTGLVSVVKTWRPAQQQTVVMVLHQSNGPLSLTNAASTMLDGAKVLEARTTMPSSDLPAVSYLWRQDGTTLMLSGVLGNGGYPEADYARVVASIIEQP